MLKENENYHQLLVKGMTDLIHINTLQRQKNVVKISISKHQILMLSKSDTRGSAMSSIAGFMSCSFMKLIYQKFSCISVLSQAELGMQLKTQLNWDQNCIFTEWNELDVKSAMFDMAEFWVSDFESISHSKLDFSRSRGTST